MLLEIRIQDFLLMEQVQVEWKQGLNVLTGETGAGKSMLLGALSLLMGSHASKESIRVGADKALIQGVFDATRISDVKLKQYGIPTDDYITISREISQNGRSVARINGMIVTLVQLKEIASDLVTIHGQNEQWMLLDKQYQMKMIDAEVSKELLNQVAEAYQTYHLLKKKIEKSAEALEDRAQTLQFLSFQVQEIEQSALIPGEDTALEQEMHFLAHAEDIIRLLSRTYEWMSSDDGESESVQLMLSRMTGKLESFAQTSDQLKIMYETAGQMQAVADDLSHQMSAYLDDASWDETRAKEVESRLDHINGLKYKYGKSVDDILARADELRAERDQLEDLDRSLSLLQEQLIQAEQAYEVSAAALSKVRKNIASTLELAILQQLQDLNMKETALEIRVISEERRSLHGNDNIEMWIRTALGQPLKPLQKVVSGGELSRMMLAIKIVRDDRLVKVFDEVDAGISGYTADVVGQKLKLLSSDSQLICITHLPQIAVYADHHLKIEKSVTKDQVTVTTVDVLNKQEIEQEIARLVGGGEKSIAHAKQLLKTAESADNA